LLPDREKLGILASNRTKVAAPDDMWTFKALSYGERWRVTRLVAKGEAPSDPPMAAAAVELAESCQRRRLVDPNP
jgi:hypothetical protein